MESYIFVFTADNSEMTKDVCADVNGAVQALLAARPDFVAPEQWYGAVPDALSAVWTKGALDECQG